MFHRHGRFPFRRLGVAVVLLLGSLGPPAFASSHSVSHYPSYYPDEIRIEAVDPAAAAKGLSDGALHAYVGASPAFAGSIPDHVKPVNSLRSFLVLTFAPGSGAFPSADRRCAAARAHAAALREKKAKGFVFHPYPVTPYHADYLHHADRAEQAHADLAKTTPIEGDDAVLEEIPVDSLVAETGSAPGLGWTPPWIKEGWFQAYRLLAPALAPEGRRAADDIYHRLVRGEALDFVEQVKLERGLVSVLAGECRRAVVGFVLRREYVSEIAPSGIENVAYDSHAGLGVPVFIRTAKLKDYPWNGQLRLGVRALTGSAWNPIAGFTDPAGRLIWASMGDPAYIPSPFNADWVSNRARADVTLTRGRSGGIKVPEGALRPEPGSGVFAPVGARAFASAKVVYELQASPYLDGTEPEIADLLYPFSLAFRWGAPAGPAGQPREPALAAAVGEFRDRLAGIFPLRVERAARAIATGFEVVRRTPVIEVYLNDSPRDENHTVALAPPWSSVPWHVLALMEEAVTRGLAAFSEQESLRRKVPWLDLVRDGDLRPKLAALIADFERRQFRPDALKSLVGADEAERRWRALREFGEKNGHFLVTSGPYRLGSWSADAVTLRAVREASYPLGFGTFDHFVHPPRAAIREMILDGNGIALRADAEITVRAGRQYRTERQPLTRTTARGTRGLVVAARFLLIGADGSVVRAGSMNWGDDGGFRIELPAELPPGRYTAMAGIFLDGNALDPQVGFLRFEIGNRDRRLGVAPR